MKSDRNATWQVCTKISYVVCFVSCLFSHKIFVLLPEAVTDREEVPATLRVHVPYVCFLTGVFRVWFIDEMHKEEHVIR